MIADRYRSLLDHLGPTMSLTALRSSPATDGVALRHDVDHDLGVALDMSACERDRGDSRATWFILHTHPYCDDAVFLDRLRQLVDDGHEIGLHLDAIGAWWRNETDDPLGELERWLDRVRGAGIEIVASAAHGARACYEGGFANHWIWSELRGDDPAAAMDGISAEGIAVDDPVFRLRYPTDHRIRRSDGAVLDLWSASMASLGIEYEACTVPVDRYWSDSGGAWTRSPDPMDHDLSRGRHQVLVHPWWWQAPRRSTLVLSTARSGTKWLCGRLERATSATVLHERTLNQHGSTTEPATGLKRTAGDLVGLLEDADRVTRLVETGLAGHRRSKVDLVEANVYLPHVDLDLLRHDDVTVVHLHRDPAGVVRSILERGWYDPPGDRRHPIFAVPGWDSMDRVARACTYWAETNRRLLDAFPEAIRVAVEDLQRDPASLPRLAARLGLVWHAIPAAWDEGPVDRTADWTTPPVEDWGEGDRRTFQRLCGPVAERLGRELHIGDGVAADVRAGSEGPTLDRPARVRSTRLQTGRVRGCRWEPVGTPIRRWLGRSHPVVLCGESGRGASAGLSRGAGWDGGPPPRVAGRLPASACLEGELDVGVRGAGFAGRLFAVEVDRRGDVIRRIPLLRIEPGRRAERFAVRIDPAAAAVHPVVLIDAADEPWRITVVGLDWRVFASPRRTP